MHRIFLAYPAWTPLDAWRTQPADTCTRRGSLRNEWIALLSHQSSLDYRFSCNPNHVQWWGQLDSNLCRSRNLIYSILTRDKFEEELTIPIRGFHSQAANALSWCGKDAGLQISTSFHSLKFHTLIFSLILLQHEWTQLSRYRWCLILLSQEYLPPQFLAQFS